VKAYYNYGRWVVDCPADDCRAALRVDEHPLVVAIWMTCDCQDESACDHQQIPCGHVFNAELPEEREDIEAITARRPRRANRNWVPGETAAGLKAENLRHGVKI
jgi:rubredoxin